MWGKEEMYTGFWWGNLKGGGPLARLKFRRKEAHLALGRLKFRWDD